MSELLPLLGQIVIEQACQRVLEQVLSEAGRTRQQLDRIESKLDRVDWKLTVGPLRSGMEFLDTGDLEKAADRFQDVDHQEPHGVTTKLARLAVAQRRGDHAEAARFFTEALLRNPFALAREAATIDRLLAFSMPRNPEWSLPLGTGPVRAEAAGVRALLDRGQAALLTFQAVISAAGVAYDPIAGRGHVAVAWIRHHGAWPRFAVPALDRPTQVVTVLDLRTGDQLWSRPTRDSIALVTPRYVVLRSLGQPEVFRLLDAGDGFAETEMSSAYFQAVFCPGWDDAGTGQPSLTSSPLYRASHHVLTTDAAAVHHHLHHPDGRALLPAPPRPPHLEVIEPARAASETASVRPLFGRHTVTLHNIYHSRPELSGPVMTSACTVSSGWDSAYALTEAEQMTRDLVDVIRTGDLRTADRLVERTDSRWGVDMLAHQLFFMLTAARHSLTAGECRAAAAAALEWAARHLDEPRVAATRSAARLLGVSTAEDPPDVSVILGTPTRDQLWGLLAVAGGLVEAVYGGDTSRLPARSGGDAG